VKRGVPMPAGRWVEAIRRCSGGTAW
jgi:hypothetical protein